MSFVNYLEANYKTFDILRFLDHFGLEDETSSSKAFKDAVENIAKRKRSPLQQWANSIRQVNYSCLSTTRVKAYYLKKAKEHARLNDEFRAIEKQALSIDTETRVAQELRSSGSSSGPRTEESYSHHDQEVNLHGESDEEQHGDENKSVNHAEFTDAYVAMDDGLKWRLSTGRVVEDSIYNFGLSINHEHLAHSFIVDPEDPVYVEKGVFTKAEVAEISSFKRKPDPVMPADFRDYINIFNKGTFKDLRSAVDKRQPWQETYNIETHGDYDWVRHSVYSLVREYEAGSLRRHHLEAWYLIHVWRVIDSVFDGLNSIEAVRGEASSIASSNRKNKKRSLDDVQKKQRKRIGRRCDIIIRSTEMEHSHMKEYGAGEAGLLLEISGTKVLKEAGLKLPKVMRDMLNDLYTITGNDLKKLRKLETIGYVHFGLSFSLLRLDSPEGYCARLRRLPTRNATHDVLTIAEDVQSFGRSVLPVLALAWKAKEMVRRVQEVIDAEQEENGDKQNSSWLEQCLHGSTTSNASPMLPRCSTSIEVPRKKNKT